MWNNYWGGRLRSRGDVPQPNYNESSDEDTFDSPLVSPARPPPTRAGSPVELAVPTLNDNVDEDLEAVQRTLANVGHTHTFRRTRPSLSDRPEPEGGNQQIPLLESAEDIVETEVGFVAGPPETCNMANGDPEVDYDTEDKVDGEKAQDYARSIKVEFEPSDIKFWFAQLESELLMAGVGSQWLKKTVLHRNLPNKQKEDVKSLLSLSKTEAGATPYLDIKRELLRIYGQKPRDTYRKALTRQMVGLPSQLGLQIVADVCQKQVKLRNCCCAGGVQAIWTDKLPVNVRGHISNMEFNADTYKQVFEAADQNYLASQQLNVAALANPSMDETLPAFTTQNQPQVAAVGRGGQNNRGGRGGGRGGRGNRGGQSNRPNQGGQGGQGGQSQGQGQNKPSRGPRHESNPPSECCDRHYRHGSGAWYCLKPATCPWANKVTPK